MQAKTGKPGKKFSCLFSACFGLFSAVISLCFCVPVNFTPETRPRLNGRIQGLTLPVWQNWAGLSKRKVVVQQARSLSAGILRRSSSSGIIF